MYDVILLKRYLQNIHKYNLRSSTYFSKNPHIFSNAITNNTPIDHEKFEDITADSALNQFEKKRHLKLFGPKIGRAQAMIISEIADDKKYVTFGDSDLNKYVVLVRLTDDGNKLRTVSGLLEKLHELYPNVMRIILGGSAIGGAFAIVTAIIKLVVFIKARIDIPFI